MRTGFSTAPPPMTSGSRTTYRESVLTTNTSDTATQYPRRDVQSEWFQENLMELENHQDSPEVRRELQDIGELLRKPTRGPDFQQLAKQPRSRVVSWVLMGVLVVVIIAVIGVVGSQNGGDNGVRRFSEAQLRQGCSNFPATGLEGEDDLIFGSCLDESTALICSIQEGGPFADEVACSAFSPNSVCRCNVGEGIDLEGAIAEICNEVDLACNNFDLSDLIDEDDDDDDDDDGEIFNDNQLRQRIRELCDDTLVDAQLGPVLGGCLNQRQGRAFICERINDDDEEFKAVEIPCPNGEEACLCTPGLIVDLQPNGEIPGLSNICADDDDNLPCKPFEGDDRS